MPGVTVTTATRSGPVDPNKPPSGQWFVVGQAERGPTDEAVLLTGMADYRINFGERVSYGFLYDQAKEYFDDGGAQMWVARIVGPAAGLGTLTLQDRATTPAPTLRIDAASEGAWSANLLIAVEDGFIANTFRIQLQLNGVVVEDYNNLTSPANAVDRLAKSRYVNVTNLGSATAAPNNNPAVLVSTALSAGTDDRASVTDADYTTALGLFDIDKGVGAVSIPGIGSSVHQAIVDHCEATNRIAILSTEQGASKTDLLSLIGSVISDSAGIFAPWVKVSDGAGGTRTISPEGYVAACRARAHVEGSWVVPAGKVAQSDAIIDLDQIFTTDDANELDAAGISLIRRINGTFRLYGYRSLSNDEANYYFLSTRDLVNNVQFMATKKMEDYEFRTVDSKNHLLSAVNSDLVGIVDPIAQAGGLYGTYDGDGVEIDPGYSVDTSSNVNTPDTLANNEVHARISLRPSPSAADIILEIVRVGFNAAV